jgi:hypothetical protein
MYIDLDTIYVEEFYPNERVLVIKEGRGSWHNGRLHFGLDCFVKGDDPSPTDATTDEVLKGLNEAICSLNDRMKGGF